jgi:hypothetical protein
MCNVTYYFSILLHAEKNGEKCHDSNVRVGRALYPGVPCNPLAGSSNAATNIGVSLCTHSNWAYTMPTFTQDGPGIESRWEARFSAAVQTGPGAHAASYTMGTGSLSRG